MELLKIRNLDVAIGGRKILNRFNLSVKRGQIHAFMGPNGAGKSTLAKVLAGHPSCEVTSGSLEFEGADLFSLPPEERARLGMFVGFQYPVEIPGVSNFEFLRAAYSNCKREISEKEFQERLTATMKKLSIPLAFKDRTLNEGFSGGEKKRNEMLQMGVLEPKLALLDEIDSGLDIDAMKEVVDGIHHLHEPTSALLLITHYPRFLDYLKPHFVHVMIEGRIVETGGMDLVAQIEKEGYQRYHVQ